MMIMLYYFHQKNIIPINYLFLLKNNTIYSQLNKIAENTLIILNIIYLFLNTHITV